MEAHITISKTEPAEICCMSGTQTAPRGGKGWDVGGRDQTEGTHAYLWLMLGDA